MGKPDLGSLRAKLVFLIVITILPVFTLIIITGMQERASIRNRALAEVFSQARNISISEGNSIEGIRKSLFLISQMLRIHDLSPENTEVVLNLTMADSPELVLLTIAEPNGDIVADSSHYAGPSNISNLPSFKRLIQTRQFVIGEYQKSRINGKPLLMLHHPVFDREGNVKKIISAGIDLATSDRIIDKQSFSPNTQLAIIDQRGSVIFQFPRQGHFMGEPTLLKNVMQDISSLKSGTKETVGPAGMPYIYGFTAFGQSYGIVYVAVALPRNELLAPVNRATLYRLLWLLGVMSLAVLMALLFGRRAILLPLANLFHAAKQIEKGDVAVRVAEPAGKGELSELARAFNRMGEALQQREEARAEAIEALQESEVKLRTIFESSVDAIGVSRSGIQTLMNPAYLSLFGYRHPAELIGQPVLLLIAPSEHEIIQDRVRSHAAGIVNPAQYETRGRRKDGSEFDMDVHVSVFELAGENYSLVILRDITQRKQAETALKMRERQLAESQRIAHIGSWEHNLETNAVFWSDELYRLLGLDPEKGQADFRSFFDMIHPDDQAVLQQAIDRTLQQHVPFDIDYRFILADGSIRIIHAQAELLPDTSGNMVVLSGTGQDVTERRQVEEEKKLLEERLQRAEKMEALGQLAGGVAHDLNNILGILTGYSELLLAYIPEGNKARGYVEKILQSAGKGATIIDDLLTLARRGVMDLAVINLNGIVAGFLETPPVEKLKDYYPRVAFRVMCGRNLLNIKGSPVHLEKMLMNLVANAAEAISGYGEVSIYTENCYLDMPLRGYDDVKPGIDGLETYRRILTIKPDQKVILVSGFSETDRVKEAQRLGAGSYVKKPYVMETIGMAIRDALAGQRIMQG